ncbi:hypothetical protein OG741_32200 [Streptomyces sp. NBC_01410]|uniref:hypothetical protein n=1 Tax=Streptomyces sp. NBC_01410 TaxID=2903856 RepID=UPI003253A0F1
MKRSTPLLLAAALRGDGPGGVAGAARLEARVFADRCPARNSCPVPGSSRQW